MYFLEQFIYAIFCFVLLQAKHVGLLLYFLNKTKIASNLIYILIACERTLGDTRPRICYSLVVSVFTDYYILSHV